MKKFKVKSTSDQSADVAGDIVLSQTQTTRKVFRPKVVENKSNPEACVRGHIIHQRKSSNDLWEDIDEIRLNKLKSGEGVKLLLRSEQVKKLYDELKQLYALGKDGVPHGEKEYVVGEADEVIKVPEKRQEVIKQLLEKDYGDAIWRQLLETKPDLATRLAHSKIQTQREAALEEFESSLRVDRDESYWQQFFVKNDWIFGYGLNYQFLHLLAVQPDYGGTAYTGKGAQKGDYLTATKADESKFTVLVEIKKPNTPLFTIKKSGDPADYRNGVPLIGRELAGGVSQVQVNCNNWELEGSRTDGNRQLEKDNIYTHQPKGILVIGHTDQLDSLEKRKAFELYRKSIHNPEILAFDELYERAKYIVGNTGSQAENNDS